MFVIRTIQVLGAAFAAYVVLLMLFGPSFTQWIVHTTDGFTVLKWTTPALFWTAAIAGLIDLVASRHATRQLTKTALFYLGAAGLVLWTILGFAFSPFFVGLIAETDMPLIPFFLRWGPILAIVSMIALSRDSFMMTKRHHGHFNPDAIAAQ